MVRDVGLAEDLAQDALVIALERWPESGIPE
jgi:predicted RNA polymerase sigma factor